jgi:hypothetical protein
MLFSTLWLTILSGKWMVFSRIPDGGKNDPDEPIFIIAGEKICTISLLCFLYHIRLFEYGEDKEIQSIHCGRLAEKPESV